MNIEGYFKNVKCDRCGDNIPLADNDPCTCTRCRTVVMPGQGNGFHGHYDDDPSGASGSWDNAVKMYEDNQ